jgi:glycosyltransferase involved in cell wall biosynthesis
MTQGFHVLITNIFLTSRTGTEIVVRDLALGLARVGHHPMVYSPHQGSIANEIRDGGVPVVNDLRDLPRQPEIIHGHHHVQTLEALLHFPTIRGIFVCHDRTAWHDVPPLSQRIEAYVAVDLNCRERLREYPWVPEKRIRVIYNGVDTARFSARVSLPAGPQRAAVFSNYAGIATHVEYVSAACREVGIFLDVIGAGSGNSVDDPEQVLGRYDLVFAKARCALEAMATGCAVILCDRGGLGPMVTASTVAQLRPWNFGERCLSQPLDVSRIIREIRRYDPDDAAAVSRYVREHASLSNALGLYLGLYAEIMADRHAGPSRTVEDLREYAEATIQRLGELELEVARHKQPYRMEPLPETTNAQLFFTIMEAPAFARARMEFRVQVEIDNQTRTVLGSFPPFPLHLSYHWMSVDGREMLLFDGLRTHLSKPLAPGEKRTYPTRVLAPDEPGNYRLRCTLVQEGFRWLDQSQPPLCADKEVEVI